MALKHQSIKLKLIIVSGITCLITAVVCCAGFIRHDLSVLRSASEDRIQSIAEMLAFNSTAVLSFNESEAATDLLKGLGDQNDVELAALYTVDGKILADYKTVNDSTPPHRNAGWGISRTSSGKLQIVQPVREAEELVGTVLIRVNQDRLTAQIQSHLKLALTVFGLSVCIAVFLISWLQRFISDPILRLSKTAKHVTSNGDFSVRVNHDSTDEIGILYASFNQMLERVDRSEKQQREYNDRLERAVSQRTSDLKDEITRHKETEKSLIAAKDRAEQANQVKSEFMANMSHEIRTPMNAIIGFTSLLKSDLVAPEVADQREYAEMIDSSANHLLSLINDVLDIAKVESGKLNIEETTCSPHQVISEIVSIMRVRANEKSLGLEYRWERAIPESIQSDPARLRQILINLVGNAIKFTDHGRIEIVAQLIGDFSAPRLQIDVIDTGIGVAPNKQDAIFEPFVQADGSLTRQYGGTGLGLSICRKLAQKMGNGELTVTSEPGVGSCFTLTIDANAVNGTRLLQSPESDIVRVNTVVPKYPDHTQTNQPLCNMPANVLVIEDGETNQKLLSLVLRRAGHSVQCAANGLIGYERAIGGNYDVIFMDMQMPVMDGYEATRKLRADGYDKPIIALTAHAMSGDKEKCFAAGCSDYLTKPIATDDLTRSLSKWLSEVPDASQ